MLSLANQIRLGSRRTHRRGGAAQPFRRGLATVELALCLPMLLIFALGTTEVCNWMHVRQRAMTAAYDGIRYATRPTTSGRQAATSAQVIARCQTLLTQLQVNGATVTVNPSNLTNIMPETQVTVTITVPMAQNSMSAYVLNSNSNVTATATMIFE
jgi:Flp pilus assembly protein TadG